MVEKQPLTYSAVPTLTAPGVFVIPPPEGGAIPAPEHTQVVEHRAVGGTVESKLQSSAPSHPTAKRGRTIFPWHPRFSRRSLVISAVGLAAVAIIAVSLVAAPILSGGGLPFWQGTASSQTAVTPTTGGALSVQINIANNPTTLGSVQTITVTVLDQNGQPVPEAMVHLEITSPYTSPSGNPRVSDGLTDTNGAYALTWQILAMPDNIGTCQLKASATKTGYQTGQAEATFEVTEATAP